MGRARLRSGKTRGEAGLSPISDLVSRRHKHFIRNRWDEIPMQAW